MISYITKRDGSIAPFQSEKIYMAILRAGNATHEFGAKEAKAFSTKVSQIFQEENTSVEEIQNSVENILLDSPYKKSAKAFILYRQKRIDARKDRNSLVDVQTTINEYLERQDWRVNANSNQGYSLGGLILNTAGKVSANYWLTHVYPSEVETAHREADFHIHDLDMISGYCAGWSLRALLEEGFNGVPNKVESNPPKHFSSAVAQMVNFLGTLQNEWAGAQAFSSFDTYMAPFVKKYEIEIREKIQSNKISFPSFDAQEQYISQEVTEYVYQNMQSFIFNLNVPSRWGTQTPFTNITLDWVCPDDLKDRKLKLGGEPFEYTFGELQKEMDIINKAFIKVMTKGDSKGRIFTFPIPTYNITKDFNWEDSKTEALFEMTAKYGIPYFQNFINSDLKPGDVRSMCCRLQLDMTELRKRGGGLFGSAEMTGSIGVVTVNAARIGYTSKGSKKKFFHDIEYLMELAKTSLELKRKSIQHWLDHGLYPFTRRYLLTLRNHFSTIGVNGLNEAIRNFTQDKENITTPFGHAFAGEVLDFMRDKLKEFQEETGNLYNLEATPAEGTTYRFAKEDKKRFPDILQAGTSEAPYYTNSSQLPVGYTDDVFEALEMQDDLQTKYTGGTVLHCYMTERISNSTACKNLIKTILTRFRLPYITITPTFSICPNHGYLQGEYDFCPKCDELQNITAPKLDTESRSKYVSTKSEW